MNNCIGQWARHNADKQEKNSIITSFNRNFAKRNDGNPNTHSFVASPEIVTAMAIAGDLTFNPLTDTLVNEAGETVRLEEPSGLEMPARGFAVEDNGYQEPISDGRTLEVRVDPHSDRLQLLSPFGPWDGKDLTGLRLLIKAKGKCTTDHISMAGPWLRFRGHLDNISNNLLIGAVNAANDRTNLGRLTSSTAIPACSRYCKAYKAAGMGSIVVGDEDYGEGSPGNMQPWELRHLGCGLFW
jgi:aconitate hydratase